MMRQRLLPTLTLLVLASFSSVAMAAPEQPALASGKMAAVWVGYAVMFLLVLAVLGVSLMPSKRSHQD